MSEPLTARRPSLRRGVSRVIRLPDTTSAVVPTWEVPGEGVYLLEAVTFAFSAVAGGAARSIVIEYADESGAIAAAVASPFTRAGGGQSVFSFGVGLQQFGANNAAFIGGPLPPLHLTSRFTVFVVPQDGNIADSFAGVRLVVREHYLDVEG